MDYRDAARRPRERKPSLLTLVHRLVRDRALWKRGELVLCACSGGADSTALLHVLALLRRRLGHQLCAVGVDHGLRADAAAELEQAAQLAASLAVPFVTERLAVEPGANLQARAREARFGALGRVAVERGASCVATGHTADDRAETFLLRLLRGAGPRGLAVLPPMAPWPGGEGPERALRLVRPLLLGRRSDVLGHLERSRIGHAEDPSNRDERFLRVRVRREVLPALERLSPRIVEHVCALCDMLQRATGEPGPFAELGRAQQLAVERAGRLGKRRATVRLGGGRDLEVLFVAGAPVLPHHS
jgi:tRNA(Ile)-lysidine synthase